MRKVLLHIRFAQCMLFKKEDLGGGYSIRLFLISSNVVFPILSAFAGWVAAHRSGFLRMLLAFAASDQKPYERTSRFRE
jgi:hypothetical protein